MGKVYDALRRAEEQRARRIEPAEPPALGEPAAVASAAPLDLTAPVGRRGARRKAFWKRFGPRRKEAVGESAAAYNKRRIALLQPESFVAEQFRTLRARIDSIAAQQPLRSIAVTSSLPGEGKTTAAINLAVVTAMSVGRRVLLVDCDLRKPAMHKALGIRVTAGLAEVLAGQATVEDAIVRVEGTNLDVLPVFALPANPSELLASRGMQELIEQVVTRYDRVILDVPPTIGLPDAKTMSEISDGVVFVVRADQTPQDEVRNALEILDRRRVLGLVLNGVSSNARRYGYTG